MNVLRSMLIVACCGTFASGAHAQISLVPPSVSPPQVTNTPEPKPKKTVPIKRPAAAPAEKQQPSDASKTHEPSAEETKAAVLNEVPNVDLVYGAYQRGHYRTAFDFAMLRAQEKNDTAAMTMLGELYANGQGVKRDYAKATEWYKRASDLGDREAMFALAMLKISGRGGPADREGGARLLASSAKLGEPKACYNLALLYMDGQTLPQDFKRAAELLRTAADAGNDDAQYALASFYKAGTGVEKDLDKSVRLLQAASVAGNVPATVEYAIALFNGNGTTKNEAAAISLLRKAARQNNAIAQNRLARVLVLGKGVAIDQIEGLKWHLVAKTAGKGDLMLDEAMAQLNADDRAKVEAAAAKWLGTATNK